MKKISLRPDLDLAYLGPDIHAGPLPALFYFALSDDESLTVNPYNQPALFFSDLPARVFSMTLPGHGPGLPSTKAMNIWAEEIEKGHDLVTEFIDKVSIAVDYLLNHNALLMDKTGVAGLSRGGYIAAHAAARLPLFRFVLGFAPLTQLSYIKEFHTLVGNTLSDALNIENLVSRLIDRKLRFYIGNCDTRVGTAECFHFIEALTEAAFQNGIRSPQTELIIYPSIGAQGHGTPPHIFNAGISWMAEQLGVSAP